MDKITGDTLVAWGFKPGKWFKDAIHYANEWVDAGKDEEFVRGAVRAMVPKEPDVIEYRTNSIPFGTFLDPETDDEKVNYEAVVRTMDALLRTPTIERAAVMPDACPAGPVGTIPVGGVVETNGTIHPGFHSADICCSMAITVFNRDQDTKTVLDLAAKVTHFGYGKRSHSEVRRHRDLLTLVESFEENEFLRGEKMAAKALDHFMTQGDGNHFFYVGHLKSSGQLAIVTHHGSRGLGAELYRMGKAAAVRHTAIHSPRTPEENAWLDFDSEKGQSYWDALQLVRTWTKMNHFAIHDEMSKRMGNKVVGRFWNEHNFVFKRGDKFLHGKGATPNYSGFSNDDAGMTLIPMNMGQPIMIVGHTDNQDALGFAPHGAGRNLSRSAHLRRLKESLGLDPGKDSPLSKEQKVAIVAKEAEGIDCRFFSGTPDVSELPSAYKDPDAVRGQIAKYGIGRVIDEVLPAGSMMAGELDEPWKRK